VIRPEEPTPAALRALAYKAATRGEWIKAADLHAQASDLERLAEILEEMP
jgi:hypothetical protein